MLSYQHFMRKSNKIATAALIVGAFGVCYWLSQRNKNEHNSYFGVEPALEHGVGDNKQIKTNTNEEQFESKESLDMVPMGLYLDNKDEGKYIVMESEHIVNSKYQLLVSGFINDLNSDDLYVPQLIVKLCDSYYWFPEGIEDYLKLKTENMYYLIDKQSASLSEMIPQTSVWHNGYLSSIELKVEDDALFQLVLQYLCHHNGVQPEPIAKPIRSVKMERIVADKWDADFVNRMSKKQLFQLITTANYLSISCLVHLGCSKVATLIKGKSPEEIKNILADNDDNQ